VSNEAVKVLVADDGRENREFIVDYILKPNGFVPLIARDGVETMELVHQHNPDIILLDYQMPRMNGLQVLDALQAEGRVIPVILMTFHGSEEIAIEVYRKGVRDYVNKPYTVDEMTQAIDHVLAEVRLRKEKDALTERLLHANAALNRRLRELNTLYQIGKSVTSLMGMEQLLTRIVNEATQVVGAQQGSLLMVEGDQLVCRAIKTNTDNAARPAHEFSRDKIAWHAVKTGQQVVLSAEQLQNLRAKDPTLPSAAMSIPLKIGSRVVGVLSISNVTVNSRPFTKQDGAMVSALGDYAAIAIENARIYTQLEESASRETEYMRSVLERYIAPSVVDRVLKNADALDLGGSRREVTVLFADVRGFTAFSEQAAPEDVVKLLNDYFSIATNVIFTREGTLDKFQGDAVMAIFNAPEFQDDHAYRAADTAMALQRAIAERNIRAGTGLSFGIGVHLGEAVVGNIGTIKAMNYTAIGDTVNVAKRLQERAEPGQVLITSQVYERLGDSVQVKSVGEFAVKGRSQPLHVYELVALA
jgi:class 3 adenylate cyclase/CheY-like chemotaxis protein